MRGEIILCTRNRAEDVARLFANLPAQVLKPPLLVVDSSDGAETESLVRAFAESGAWTSVRYLPSGPGLTRQRMIGVASLRSTTDLVHFIDDDVLLEPEYFWSIEALFDGEPECVGVGGWITNEPMHKPRWSGRLFYLDSFEQGRILPSGVNTFVFRPDQVLRVDWLSGACMSYRRDIFEKLSFDTRMTGYSLGEDVDFSFRVGKLGHLWVTPDAPLEHLTSPVNRYDARRFMSQDLVRRHAFVARYRGSGISLTAFWWSVFGDVALTVAKTVFYSDRDAWRARLAGLFDGIGRLMRGEGRP